MDYFIGGIIFVGFNFAPRYFAQCAGQTLSIAQNTALFSLLGTYYGGNGQTTFMLPDLRGRSAIGFGAGPGLQPYSIGQAGGAENVTLTLGNLPAHNHPVTITGAMEAVNIKATEPSPAAGRYLARSVDAAATPTSNPEIYLPGDVGTPAPKVPLAGLNVAGTVGSAGLSQPAPVLSPYLAINPCIALQGIFPSRN